MYDVVHARSPLRRALFCITVLLFTACSDSGGGGGGGGTEPPAIASVAVLAETTALTVGESVQLTASARDESGAALTGRSFAWSSSNQNVASVTSAGMVRALSEGETRISASSDGRSGSVTITVEPVAVASVIVEPDTATREAGSILALRATALSATGDTLADRTVAWSTSDSAVVTVDAGGTAVFVGEGSAYAVAEIESVRDSAALTTVSPSGYSLVIRPDSIDLPLGAGADLEAVLIDPAQVESAAAGATWTSSDTTRVRVSATGEVTAIALGSATISAVAGTLHATSHVRVLEPAAIPAAAITLDADTLRLDVDETVTLAAEVRDAGGNLLAGKVVTWTSANDAVATVSAQGLVTAKAGGAVWIQAVVDAARDSAYVVVSAPIATGGQISAGNSSHSCGITADDVLYCWGSPYYLGDSTLVNAEFPYGPYPIDLPGRVVQADAGRTSTLALLDDGSAWMWGQDVVATIAGVDVVYQPVRVAGAPPFVSITAGGGHAVCGLTADGDAYCWGSNASGALGIGSATPFVATPTPVAGGHKFVKLALESEVSGGLTADGRVLVWGDGNYGTVGDGYEAHGRLYEPTPVVTDLRFTDLEAFRGGFVALDADGRAYQWGVINGQWLIDGPVPVETDQRFTRIDAGAFHILALTADGEAWGWGANDESQVGSPGATQYASPVRVQTDLRFTDISAAEDYSLAIGTDGAAYGWGTDINNRLLGIHPGGSTSTPVGNLPPRQVRARMSATSIGLIAGTTAEVDMTIHTEPGSFTIHGPQTLSTITLSVTSSLPGLTASISPTSVQSGGAATLTLSAAADAAAGSGHVVVNGQTPGETPRVAGGAQVSIAPPPPPGEEYACPTGTTPLPVGYHCMSASATSHIAGKYNDPELHGWWVDESAEVCMYWGSNGEGYARYRANGSVSETGRGEWGAMINPNGTRYPNEQYWHIFTETADPQVQLLTYDSATGTIVNWGFTKRGSCAW